MEPTVYKDSVVWLLCNEETKDYFVIVKLLTETKAQLIRIDPVGGALRHDPAKDVFDNEGEAKEYLKTLSDPKALRTVGYGKALLGYIVIGPLALLLVAEGVRASAVLPGGHEVKTVTTSKWYTIPLQQDLDCLSRTVKEDLEKQVGQIRSFPIDGAHYYCETMDISRPFPSMQLASEPSWEFIWNRWLTTSFRHAGLQHVCAHMLQGMCEVRSLEDFDGQSFNFALISRRGRLHVGPRYKARGLNEAAEPGNEIECEQVVWNSHEDGTAAWSRYTWRRGSVPIWWTVVLKNGIGEAEIKIRQSQTFKGSRRYMRRLQKRYAPDPRLCPVHLPGADQKEISCNVPVCLVSLLRKGTPDRDRSEAKLAAAYDTVVTLLNKEHSLPLTACSLDWHELDKQLGTEILVEAFWSQVQEVLPQHGFALGQIRPCKPNFAADGSWLTWSPGWEVLWHKQQHGVARYNCADSLDRTNVASFFGAVQVLVEMCRELDVAIVASHSGAASIARQALQKRAGAKDPKDKSGFLSLDKFGNKLNKMVNRQSPNLSPRGNGSSMDPVNAQQPDPHIAASAQLPLGWEAKYDKTTQRVFYVDHINRITTWEKPSTMPAAVVPTKAPNTTPRSSAMDLAGLNKSSESCSAADGSKVGFGPLTPWGMLSSGVKQFGMRVSPEALSVVAELFLVNGDLSAWLYTGSQAMHSDKLLIFEPETSRLRKAGAGMYGNPLIAIKRRYNNIVMDEQKLQQLELFLGLKTNIYWNGIDVLYKDSDVVPLDYPESDEEPDPVAQLDWPPRDRVLPIQQQLGQLDIGSTVGMTKHFPSAPNLLLATPPTSTIPAAGGGIDDLSLLGAMYPTQLGDSLI